MLCRNTVKRNEKASHKLGKTCANDLADKGLVCRTYKEPSKLNNKITNHPIFKKRAQDLNRHFPKENIAK